MTLAKCPFLARGGHCPQGALGGCWCLCIPVGGPPTQGREGRGSQGCEWEGPGGAEHGALGTWAWIEAIVVGSAHGRGRGARSG